MNYCRNIKNLIDEAERPDLLPGEAARHVTDCPECKGFAEERTKLRELMVSPDRVTVPLNFDAMLKDRLSLARSPKPFWSTTSGLMRLGTAAAGLAIMVAAAQFGGFFSSSQPTATDNVAGPATPEIAQGSKGHEEEAVLYSPPLEKPAVVAVSTRGPKRVAVKPVKEERRRDSTLYLVREQGRDIAVPMKAVSLGMQQQLLNSWGRQQPRSADISY